MSRYEYPKARLTDMRRIEYAMRALFIAVMPAIVRESDHPYRWKIGVAPLADVANREKMLPRDFISEDGYGITEKARAYLAPLIRGEDPPPYRDGLPQYVRLRNVEVARKLGNTFAI